MLSCLQEKERLLQSMNDLWLHISIVIYMWIMVWNGPKNYEVIGDLH